MIKLGGFDLKDLRALRLPAFALPKFGNGRSSAALVLYPQEVQLVWLTGLKVAGQIRTPINGSDVNALVQAIRQALAAAKLKSSRVAVAIASPDILVRFFKIPPIPSDERDSAIPLEARKYIPFKVDELAWDYAMTAGESAQDELKSLEVVFSAIPGEILARFQNALAMAGLQATSIEPLSQSLARFATTNGQNGKATHVFECLVQIRRDCAHILIAQRGMPYLVREIQSPVQTPGQSAEGSTTLIQRLVSELSVSMDFFKREYASALFDRVRLFAEEDAMGHYVRELSALLPYPVESAAKGFAETEQGVSLSYAAALGVLRASANKGTKCSLDFLQHLPSLVVSEVAVSKSSRMPSTDDLLGLIKSPLTLSVAALTAAILSGLLWFMGNAQIVRMQQRIGAVRQARAALPGAMGDLEAKALQPMQDLAREQLRVIKGLIDQRPRLAEKLDVLPRILPNGIWLTTLNFEHKIEISKNSKKQSQALLALGGACYLGAGDQELRAIQDFEARVKNNPTLQKDLPPAQLGKITGATSPGNNNDTQSYTYKQFQLSCQSNKSGKI